MKIAARGSLRRKTILLLGVSSEAVILDEKLPPEAACGGKPHAFYKSCILLWKIAAGGSLRRKTIPLSRTCLFMFLWKLSPQAVCGGKPHFAFQEKAYFLWKYVAGGRLRRKAQLFVKSIFNCWWRNTTGGHLWRKNIFLNKHIFVRKLPLEAACGGAQDF